MDERWVKAIQDAESAGRLLALARAEGLELSAERAEALFKKYHPPWGALTDRELEDVTGGGCGGSSAPQKRLISGRQIGQNCPQCGYDCWGVTVRGEYNGMLFPSACTCGVCTKKQESQPGLTVPCVTTTDNPARFPLTNVWLDL